MVGPAPSGRRSLFARSAPFRRLARRDLFQHFAVVQQASSLSGLPAAPVSIIDACSGGKFVVPSAGQA